VKIMIEHDLELARQEERVAKLPALSHSPFA
jgi:hypothetical protein